MVTLHEMRNVMLQLPPVVIPFRLGPVKTELLQWIVQQSVGEGCEPAWSESYFGGVIVKTFGQKSSVLHEHILLIPEPPVMSGFWPHLSYGDFWAVSFAWGNATYAPPGGRLAINANLAFVDRLTNTYNHGRVNGFAGYVAPSQD
jgi:hypothetical protein